LRRLFASDVPARMVFTTAAPSSFRLRHEIPSGPVLAKTTTTMAHAPLLAGRGRAVAPQGRPAFGRALALIRQQQALVKADRRVQYG
jgi:hypothetical protein